VRKLVFLCLTFAACHSAFRTAVELAEQALLRNDLAEAARQYLVACRIDPDAKKVCERAKNLTAEVVQHAVEEASLACGKGDIDTCLDLLVPARRISTDPRLFEVAKTAADLQAERCAAPQNELIQKAGEVRCLESRHRKVAVQTYTDLIGARRDETAALMLERAQSSGPALAAVLAEVAMCTAKGSLRKEERDLAGQRLLDAAAVPFHLKVSAQGLGDASDVLQSACKEIDTRTAARCSKLAAGTAVLLQLDANVSDTNHTVQDDHRSVRYVAGIDHVPNPAYAPAKDRVRRLESDLSQRRSERDQARSRCSSAESRLSSAGMCVNCPPRSDRDRACSDADGLDSAVRSLENDFSAAQSELSRTPELIDRERWETHNYVARVHRYWVDFTLHLARPGAEPQAAAGRLDYSGEDRQGFSPAQISASVARPPTFRDFAVDLYPREKQLILGAVADAMKELAEKTEAGCGTNDDAFFWPWLDCHLRAALYRDGNMVTPFWRAVEPRMAPAAREVPEYACE
jgi:hypothetical protein